VNIESKKKKSKVNYFSYSLSLIFRHPLLIKFILFYFYIFLSTYGKSDDEHDEIRRSKKKA